MRVKTVITLTSSTISVEDLRKTLENRFRYDDIITSIVTDLTDSGETILTINTVSTNIKKRREREDDD